MNIICRVNLLSFCIWSDTILLLSHCSGEIFNNELYIVQEALDTLVKRGVIFSKEAALDVLAIISHETSLSFRHLEIEIKNGIYDQV